MINLLQAVALGVLEGVTEFLPISSTGHLLVASPLLGIPNTKGTFEIVIQGGAVAAVVWFYRRELWRRLRGFPREWEARRFWFTLLVAFLPAALVGLTLDELLDHLLERNGLVVQVIAWALILGGLALSWADRRHPAEEEERLPLSHLTFRQASLIGLAQCLALIPGVSRSGSSIVGGLLVGLSRAQATEFSFYLALPTLGAATAYKLVKGFDEIQSAGGFLPLVVSTGFAFLTSILAMGWLLRYVSRHDFGLLVRYRIGLGALLLALIWGGWLRS